MFYPLSLLAEHGWVQSYGSRYTRPPVVVGDISRSEVSRISLPPLCYCTPAGFNSGTTTHPLHRASCVHSCLASHSKAAPHSLPPFAPLQPMTVHEYELAQSLTAKPVKGMLTGWADLA